MKPTAPPATGQGPAVRIVEAATPADVERARALFLEYGAEFAGSICDCLQFQRFDDEVAGLPGKYAPPSGRLLLAGAAGEAIGCLGLRDLGGGACEMKRLFVRPPRRGRGVGVGLIRHALEVTRGAGYRVMRLDTVPEMGQAARLYLALGFAPIGPYYDNPVAKSIDFEADLARAPGREPVPLRPPAG